jgi:D-alanine-D-alanine ligase
MVRPRLVLIHEPEATCRTRLKAQGFAERQALEISSYLAQCTDLALEFDEIARACTVHGIDFAPLELDEAAAMLPRCDPERTLVWTLSDGIAYFHGSAGPALARLNGLPTIGSDDSLFALCQDKFRSGAVLHALDLPVPQSGLARNGVWLAEPPASASGWFVKPNRLGAKIGIWPDSRCENIDQALELSRRVFSAYRDDVVVQPYVRGRNVRASFLGLTPQTVSKRLASLSSIPAATSRPWKTASRSMARPARAPGRRAPTRSRISRPWPPASRSPMKRFGISPPG